MPMRQVDLEEYEPSKPIRLSGVERDALRAIPSLAVERADIEDRQAAYTLKPSSTVGAVEIGDLSVLIKPKIPIPQLLSLACYAMSKFKPYRKCSTTHVNTRYPIYWPSRSYPQHGAPSGADCSTATSPRRRRCTPCAGESCSPSRYDAG